MRPKSVVIIWLAALISVNNNISALNRTDNKCPAAPLEESSDLPTYIPLVGIKTNALYWAGFNPEMKWKQVLPNLSLEFYMGKRWSLALNGAFTSHLRNGHHLKKRAFSSFGPEFRVWLNDDSLFKGFYGGVYMDGGEFDLTPKSPDGTGHTGTYFGTGLAAGYVWMFTPWLGMELGIRGGFRHAACDDYFQEKSHFYYQRTHYKNNVCLNGVFLNFTVRLGKYKK